MKYFFLAMVLAANFAYGNRFDSSADCAEYCVDETGNGTMSFSAEKQSCECNPDSSEEAVSAENEAMQAEAAYQKKYQVRDQAAINNLNQILRDAGELEYAAKNGDIQEVK